MLDSHQRLDMDKIGPSPFVPSSIFCWNHGEISISAGEGQSSTSSTQWQAVNVHRGIIIYFSMVHVFVGETTTQTGKQKDKQTSACLSRETRTLQRVCYKSSKSSSPTHTKSNKWKDNCIILLFVDLQPLAFLIKYWSWDIIALDETIRVMSCQGVEARAFVASHAPKLSRHASSTHARFWRQLFCFPGLFSKKPWAKKEVTTTCKSTCYTLILIIKWRLQLLCKISRRGSLRVVNNRSKICLWMMTSPGVWNASTRKAAAKKQWAVTAYVIIQCVK